MIPGPYRVLDPDSVRDLRPEALDEHGTLRVLPAAFWQATTVDERALFGLRTGSYGFPTLELVAYLKELIGGRRAIEIGAGNGVLCKALGIPGTDSYQQREPKYAAHYAALQQPTVPYGAHVEKMDAATAIRHYRPEVVIGCWVTHRYDPADHKRGGNEAGPDGDDLLAHCKDYVLIGNDRVHGANPLWSRSHTCVSLPFLYSRAHGSRDFVAVFEGDL